MSMRVDVFLSPLKLPLLSPTTNAPQDPRGGFSTPSLEAFWATDIAAVISRSISFIGHPMNLFCSLVVIPWNFHPELENYVINVMIGS